MVVLAPSSGPTSYQTPSCAHCYGRALPALLVLIMLAALLRGVWDVLSPSARHTAADAVDSVCDRLTTCAAGARASGTLGAGSAIEAARQLTVWMARRLAAWCGLLAPWEHGPSTKSAAVASADPTPNPGPNPGPHPGPDSPTARWAAASMQTDVRGVHAVGAAVGLPLADGADRRAQGALSSDRRAQGALSSDRRARDMLSSDRRARDMLSSDDRARDAPSSPGEEREARSHESAQRRSEALRKLAPAGAATLPDLFRPSSDAEEATSGGESSRTTASGGEGGECVEVDGGVLYLALAQHGPRSPSVSTATRPAGLRPPSCSSLTLPARQHRSTLAHCASALVPPVRSVRPLPPMSSTRRSKALI